MWRDTIGFAGAILAVINGTLAMVIAKLPARQSVFKLRLGATALVLSVLAVGATVYARHQVRVQIERQQTERIEIRKRLDNFAIEGRSYLAQIRDGRRELPAREADEWAQKVEIFLRDKIGERAIIRFRREVNDLYGDDPLVPAVRLAYWRAVRNRTANLELINAELGDLPLRR